MCNTKKCSSCKIEKPFSAFNKESKGKYGLRSKCKVCLSEIRKEQYNKNRDKELDNNRKYRKNNKDKEKARYKRYRELNPDKVKEAQKKYRENNPELVKARRKKWAEDNKELINSYSKNHRNTRREFLDIVKLETGCELCGYNDHPRALQFDHIKPEDKEFTISSLLTCAMDKLLKEIAKCRVLCANCHSVHSWQEQHWKSKKDKTNPRVEITITERK